MSENAPVDMWRFVSGKEGAIADHLRSLIRVLPRDIGRRVERVAHQIEGIDKRLGEGDSSAQQSAFADRDLVAVVSALLERARDKQTDDELEEADLVADLQIGVSRLVRVSSERSGIIGLFVYPGLLLVGVIGIMVLFNQLILPNFRVVFNEFGIELPRVTKFMFSIGSFLEVAWPLVLLVTFLAAFPMVLELCRSMGIATGLVQWVEDKFASKRSVIGRWARHTALLLQAGINEDAAVKASMSESKSWIRSGAWPWKFGLIEQTLKLEDTAAKVALLNHAADYYHARHQSLIQWWASFLPTIAACALGGVMAFVMLSIFMPLISIISGLTGF